MNQSQVHTFLSMAEKGFQIRQILRVIIMVTLIANKL